tara:strand:- start:97 stop:501 length:405 start_codon:yes stop_codon:yes gene_type:complete
MSRWDDDKVKVKDIFDTIRNFGLCGLVFFLATKSLFYVSSVEYFNVIHRVTSACLYGLSLYLFYINTRLFNKIIKEEFDGGKVGVFLYMVIPALFFILGINIFFQSALSFQLDTNQTVGELSIKELIENIPENN